MPKEEHPNGTVFIIRLTQWDYGTKEDEEDGFHLK
jgi:hypothetical protein